MKDITNMKLGEALQYIRKENKEVSSRSKLAVRSRVSKWVITALEKDNTLPTKEQFIAICDALGNEELKTKGLAEIEYKRTHPDVKLCFSDRTHCWKCDGIMCTAYGLLDGYPLSPDDFNESMRKIAQEKGVLLEERTSGVTGEMHLVNVCPNCGAFIGEFYLHDLWCSETEVVQINDVAQFVMENKEDS